MMFEERLKETHLPDTEKLFFVCSILRMMDRLAGQPNMEGILKKVIHEINNGSVEKLETLVIRIIDRGQ